MKLLLALIFALHLAQVAVLFFQRLRRLDRSLADSRRDALFSPTRAALAYLPIFAIQAWALVNALRSPGALGFNVSTWGVVCFGMGFALRLWSVRTLGRLFTMEIGIRKEHRLVRSGPYRWVRHPSYTGYLLMLAGIGIAYRSWIATLVPLAETAVFLGLRIREEERMLERHFGKEFIEYFEKTRRLIPFIF